MNLFNFIFFVNGIIIISVFIIAQMFHEWGHYLSHYLNNRNPTIQYNKLKLPIQVTATDSKEKPFSKKELAVASFFGVFAGTLPIDVYIYLSHNLLNVFLIEVFYIYGSRLDIIDIKNLFIALRPKEETDYDR